MDIAADYPDFNEDISVVFAQLDLHQAFPEFS